MCQLNWEDISSRPGRCFDLAAGSRRHTESCADPGSTLEALKSQFHEPEAFLLELSGHQDGVGAVLEEGECLLSGGDLQHDEEREVRIQMSLLNSRWENLRKRALDRQGRIPPPVRP